MRIRAPIMYGRDRELDYLRRTVDAVRGGDGRAIFVTGEAGIGKSRLVSEAAGLAATADLTVLRGRVSTVGPMVPFRPVVEALLALFRTGRAPAASELGAYRPILGRIVPEWAGQPDRQADSSLVVLGEAVLRLLSIAGRNNGCLVVLEDLHECDAETLAVVEYLADNLAGQPVVLLSTCRVEPGRSLDLVRSAVQRDAAAEIELGRLGEADVARMVAGCLDADPDAVPRPVLDRLWRDSLGVPFVVEELLHGVLAGGALVRRPTGWAVSGRLRAEVPGTLAKSVAARVDRLGPHGRTVLATAALLGRRFPVEVVQQATGLDDPQLHGHLCAAAASQLVVFDPDDRRYCSFEHPLTTESLLAQLGPTERAELSLRAAQAVQKLYPGLPGQWCQQVAVLLLAAGDQRGAAEAFATAGRRALADGAAESAVALLERAERLTAELDDHEAHAAALESLLFALGAAGKHDRALRMIETVLPSAVAGLDAGRRAALHVRMAWIADLAGRLPEATAQVTAARQVLGEHPPDRHAAALDAVAAWVALDLPGRCRTGEAERLARRAVAAAERAALPEVMCDALHIIGAVARGRDRAEAAAAYRRALAVAQEHRLPLWPVYSMARVATLDWLFDGDAGSTELARQEASRVGALGIACNLEAVLVLDSVLRGRFGEAARRLAACRADAQRIRLARISRYLAMVGAVLAAHQAHRSEMETALAEYRLLSGPAAPEIPLTIGLAGAFCSLLEEDLDRGADELRQVREYESRFPTTYQLSGSDGIQVLLAVLAGETGRAEYDGIRATGSGQMRWNRQFVLLAGAVLAGREHRPGAAVADFERAQLAAAPYPMARHLGVRLVSAAALADGWGDPVRWLRDAEGHFYRAGVHAVAGACRALLRRAGNPVAPRRTGADQMPHALRALGVTPREYEVLRLLAERLPNKEIAGRLHLSPRTVEKYVANLMAKTGQPDRYGLSRYGLAHHASCPPRWGG